MPDANVQKFVGLPLGQLICGPIIEVAKGQAELCRVYLEYVFKMAYKDGDVAKGEANVIKFKLNRFVTDNQGHMEPQEIEVNAPLLSLIPIPAFTMDEAEVSFTMEVKETTVDTSEQEKKATTQAGFSYWGFSASITGSISAKSTHTRSTDFSAKYDVRARAIQQPPAEGMAKLSTVFASVIEPIPAKK
ncbi:MAG: DUF2589 domain-containing protein [Cystobacterineae bacterium]|nr:DUF2589 domain-containing protein [Cystobacterineae bacterium]